MGRLEIHIDKNGNDKVVKKGKYLLMYTWYNKRVQTMEFKWIDSKKKKKTIYNYYYYYYYF